MPSNVIIFDADYVAELTAKMTTACELMAEAVSSLKSAQNHENWKCKERNEILADFDELNVMLGRLDNGVNETTRILGGSVSRFSALESQYESQANNLSEELASNHGFSASVQTDGMSESGSGLSVPSAGAGGVAGADSQPEGRTSGRHGPRDSAGAAGAAGHGAGFAGGMAGRFPGMMPGSSNTAATSGGTVIMNVNLPVTYIPDNPGAAAKGIKDTREIARGVVNSVAQTMAQALAGNGSSAPHLAEAYNAGRTVFENSEVIMSSPTMPHANERLAMAAGLVTLAGSAAGAGAATLGQAVGSAQGNFAQNAGSISDALQGNDDAHEFRQVLGVFASTESSGILDLTGIAGSSESGSGKGSFFDMIIAELKKAFTGTQEGSTSSSSSSSIFSASSSTGGGSALSESSPIMEFLGNFVMDQAV